MKKSCLLFACLVQFAAFPIFSQTNISGVVNDYSEVVSIDYCQNEVGVANPAPYSVGDRVLLIQMKGAIISLDNDVLFGEIQDYNGAGNYEILTIDQVTGNTIHFQHAILKDYDIAGAVQLIRIPQYNNANVNATLTCPTWDGVTGGVVIIEVSGNLSLNADIDVSGLGFRGGAIYSKPPTFCSNGGIGGYSGYSCASSFNCGGTKGEGITEQGLNQALGRGPLANGGGGGNDHNTGGGGGSNGSLGGFGGERLNASAISCPGPYTGIPGKGLDYTNDQIFMGGGGGAGDQNNAEGSGGANGGGIVIIIANTIDGNGQSILANGIDVTAVASSDGAGGGGASGTILLDVGTVNSALNLELIGGKGGDVNNGFNPTHCMGPGGGGSGGMFLCNQGIIPVNVTVDLSGGLSGQTVNGNAHVDCFGSSNGAQPGTDGQSMLNWTLAASTVDHIPVAIDAGADQTICLGETATLNATASSTLTSTLLWSTNESTDMISVSPQQTTNYTVQVLDHRDCLASDDVNVNVTGFQIMALANPTLVSQGEFVQLSVSDTNNTYTYSWSPDTYLDNPNIYNPTSQPLATIEYCVTATDQHNCSSSDCITIDVEFPIYVVPDAFSPNGDGLNDVFSLLHSPSLQVSSMRIYNRWGELIYDNVNPWNGKVDGEDQPVGTYVYHIVIESAIGEGEVQVASGSISLVR